MKILFLSAWYPNRYDEMAGLFVRKHAQALSLYDDVFVLYLHADPKASTFEIKQQNHNGLAEVYVYFPYSTHFTKISKAINFFRAFAKGYNHIFKQNDKPDSVQANVLTRNGILALYLKITKKIPYVIVEHWTRYLPTVNSYKGIFRKIATKIVVRNCDAILPISEGLQVSMVQCGLHSNNYHHINNVVDDFFYIPQNKLSRNKKRILHISCFSEKAKNIKGLLNSIDKLRKLRNDFELIIIGTGEDFNEVRDYAQQLKLEDIVIFMGEKQPEEVCQAFYQSDFFVLFSNYENAPVVISESLACGKPVITTDVGFVQSIITDKNGKIIPIGDELALTKKMNLMLDHFQDYDENDIRKSAEQFKSSIIGKQLSNIHHNCIQKETR